MLISLLKCALFCRFQLRRGLRPSFPNEPQMSQPGAALVGIERGSPTLDLRLELFSGGDPTWSLPPNASENCFMWVRGEERKITEKCLSLSSFLRCFVYMNGEVGVWSGQIGLRASGKPWNGPRRRPKLQGVMKIHPRNARNLHKGPRRQRK